VASSQLPGETPFDLAVKPWQVLHACEKASTISALIEAETSVGMNPHVLSRELWKPESQSLSLLTTWNDVRDWRHALNQAEALHPVQIVHAHSFASAMAGVRGSSPLVYDFAYPLDEADPDRSHPGPWLLRSFRVAEQFALSRASAVVAHSQTMAKIAHDRGAASANIFRIHPPFQPKATEVDHAWAASRGIEPGHAFIVLALPGKEGVEFSLRVFGNLVREVENAVFLLEHDDPDHEQLLRLAREIGIADSLRCVSSYERQSALACTDVVLALSTDDAGGRSNPGMLSTMGAAKAVIAADVPENRECACDGQGCLWFRPEDLLDATQRILFVSKNRDFLRQLGESGREHLLATRAPEVVGRAYDEVYRHAQSRRTDTMPMFPAPKIYALGPV
jgi:glycosyltransferase involved in cell wall biosynthesis